MSRENESNYYTRTNQWFLLALYLHLPLALGTALLNSSSVLTAIMGSLLILSLPTLLFFLKKDSLQTAVSLAVGLVSFSGLLIHLANGMTEMHFHIFASLGIIIVLAQPWASLIALLVVAAHHVLFFFFLPKSLINYEAGFHILVIHAVFALATGLPAAIISKKFKAYVVVVKDIVKQTESIAASILQSTQSINQASETLAESAEVESSSLEEASATVSSLSKLAEANVKRSAMIQTQSESTQSKSKQGQRSLEQVYESVNDIKKSSLSLVAAVARSNQRLTEISDVIKSISMKTSIINDIVFQTKLLSFNASIEAARAGEHGMGFAVVAQEVGNLAVLSGKSAQDIDQLVQGSIRKVDMIVEETKSEIAGLIQKSSQQVDDCVRLTEDCRRILDEVSKETGSTATFSKEISQSSAEQSTSITEITHATDHIRGTSVRNAKLVIDTATVSRELTQASSDLSETIQSLKHAIGDSDSQRKAS